MAEKVLSINDTGAQFVVTFGAETEVGSAALVLQKLELINNPAPGGEVYKWDMVPLVYFNAGDGQLIQVHVMCYIGCDGTKCPWEHSYSDELHGVRLSVSTADRTRLGLTEDQCNRYTCFTRVKRERS